MLLLRDVTIAVALWITLAIATHAQAGQLNGAGATFPAPVYSAWAQDYQKTSGNQLNYQAIGSGGGVKQILAKTVDFGATDDPMPVADVDKNGLYQFPTVIGGVVPVVNIKGVEAGKLVLDGKTLADIYNGKITKWNDSSIAALNPSIKLPDLAITPVTRADSSGTTAVFTDYLSQVNSAFAKDVGHGKTVNWTPVNVVSGKGNAGVGATVQNTQGSIGYVEYAFAKQGKMIYVALLDKKGKQVEPNEESFIKAASGADWTVPGMEVNLNNRDGWPITAATFILVYKGQANSKEVAKFFDWAYTNGDKVARDLDYVPLPDKVKAKVRSDWAK